MSSKHLCNFLSILNLGLVTKKKKVFVKVKANYIKTFIDVLLKENFIYGYSVESKISFFNREEEIICINFKPDFLKKIKIISTPSYKKTISAYELSSIHFKNPGSFFLMSSSQLGFSSSRECQKKNLGGVLLCELIVV